MGYRNSSNSGGGGGGPLEVHGHTTNASGGQITDAALGSPVGIAKGGTGAATADAARLALDAAATSHTHRQEEIASLMTDLATKADLAGAAFAGPISAANLSGVNTGDQDLSGYAPLSNPAFANVGIGAVTTASGEGMLKIVASTSTPAPIVVCNYHDNTIHFAVDLWGNIVATSLSAASINGGTFATGASVSGANSGDQDLSGYALRASPSLTGTVNIGAYGDQGQLVVSGTDYAANYLTLSCGGNDLAFHPDNGGAWTLEPSSWLALRLKSAAAIYLDAPATTLSGAIAAANLSGVNTGDQDLSAYAPTAGAAFTDTVEINTPGNPSGTDYPILNLYGSGYPLLSFIQHYVAMDLTGVLVSADEGLIVGRSSDKVGFFGAQAVNQPAALTEADVSTPTTADAAIIANLQTRVFELETKLQALGLLGS